jgi:chromate transporter
LFGAVGEARFGPLVLHVPDVSTLDVAALAIAVGAAFATLRFHVGILRLIASCAALGVAWRLLGPGA